MITLTLSLWMGLISPFLAITAPDAPKSVEKTKTTVNSDKVAWSDTRKLTWNDFKGTPDAQNQHHALTAANLAVDAKCTNNKVVYEVKNVFLPQESWSRNKNSERLLKHEQLHFDLTEVHARMLRRKLAQLNPNCTDIKEGLALVVQSAFKDWKEEQAMFDKLSRHGLNKEEEKAWSEDVNLRLLALQAYK